MYWGCRLEKPYIYLIQSLAHVSAVLHHDADFAKLARVSPQAFSIDASSLAARWATLKQVLGWDDHQCKEALAKDMKISYIN
jgi:hypothetical protein